MPTVTYGQGSGSFSDAMVLAGLNDPTYKDGEWFRVASRADGSDLRTVMLWDLAAAGVPKNAHIVSAKLTLTAWYNDFAGSKSNLVMRVYRIADDNVDEDATWTEASNGTAWETTIGESVGAGLSSSAGGSLDTSIVLPGGRAYHVETHAAGSGDRTISGSDFTALDRDAQKNRGQKLNIMLMADTLIYASTTSGAGTDSADIGYRSSEYGTAGDRPELEITYIYPHPKPSKTSISSRQRARN